MSDSWNEDFKRDMDRLKLKFKRRTIALWTFTCLYFAVVIFVWVKEVTRSE